MAEIALVTGGSRGLGKNMALKLAQKGLNVIITYHSKKEDAFRVMEEIKQVGRKAAALQLNLGDAGSFSSDPRFYHFYMRFNHFPLRVYRFSLRFYHFFLWFYDFSMRVHHFSLGFYDLSLRFHRFSMRFNRSSHRLYDVS
jgi:hypothetical protein